MSKITYKQVILSLMLLALVAISATVLMQDPKQSKEKPSSQLTILYDSPDKRIILEKAPTKEHPERLRLLYKADNCGVSMEAFILGASEEAVIKAIEANRIIR